MLEMVEKDTKAQVRVLSDTDVSRIHEETLNLLENVGVRVQDEGGRALLAEAGAKVDSNSTMVKFPVKLVEESLNTTPRRVVLGARDPNKDVVLEFGGKMYSRNGGGPGHMIDMDTGAVVEITTEMLADYARLIDALEHIDYAAPVYSQDTPPATRDIRTLKTMFANTSKHINMRVLNVRSLPAVLKMAEIVAGGKDELKKRPVISMLESPIAPLRIPEVFVETLVECGKLGIPVELTSMPNLGVTGPITIAGSLLMSNVEMLAAIVISQVANPGAPLQFSPRLVIMDMATGKTLIGSIECALVTVAGIQLAREAYQIPINMHGPLTDSPIVDAQSAIERTYFTFLPAYAGANVLAGAGHVEQNLVVSIPQLVIDDEIHGLVNRSLEGFEVNDDTLAVDAIVRSMVEDNLLTDKHTIRHLRKERYLPHLLNRETRAAWVEGGSKDMVDRAKERARTLIKNHEPLPLSDEIDKMLDEVITEAEKVQ